MKLKLEVTEADIEHIEQAGQRAASATLCGQIEQIAGMYRKTIELQVLTTAINHPEFYRNPHFVIYCMISAAEEAVKAAKLGEK